MDRVLPVLDRQGMFPVKRLHTSTPLAAILLLAGCGKSLDGEYLNATAVMSSTPPVLKIEGGHAAFHDFGGRRLSEFYSASVSGSRVLLANGAVRIEFELRSDGKTLDCVGNCVAYADSGKFWHLHRDGWSRTGD